MRAGYLLDLVRALRPLQWIKNLACFAALIFAGKLGSPEAIILSLRAFLIFSLASSCIYILNDLVDREKDRLSPKKSKRPIAAGRINTPAALLWLAVVSGGMVTLLLSMPLGFQAVILAYGAMMLGYVFGLKKVAILDVLMIALGFVLRVQAGIEALGAPQSTWILLCMLFLALFLGFAKRAAELGTEPEAGNFRTSLKEYTPPFLNSAMTMSASLTIVTYALYSVLVQDSILFLGTLLPVTYGIFRYFMLTTWRASDTDAPEKVVVTDIPLLGSILVWGLLCFASLYAKTG
jgi:4-hydroxybenzoate polyprenyltransferase